jgi:hypothetical protein
VEAEFRSAPDFAEVAEALGVNTVDIMAWSPQVGALFTPEPDQDDPVIYVSLMDRDADGILRAGPWMAYGTVSKFQAEADEQIRKTLREKLGPPDNEGSRT